MNKVIFTGFITKKGIDLKYANEKAVATYSLAIKGIKKDEVTYANMVTWGAPAEFLANNQDRIKSLVVEARYSTRTYDNKEGIKVYVHEFITNDVEVKEWKNEGQAQQEHGLTPVDDDQECPF